MDNENGQAGVQDVSGGGRPARSEGQVEMSSDEQVYCDILMDVWDECDRSVALHGAHAQGRLEWGNPNLFYNLAEEFGEVAHALTYDADGEDLRKELVQVAAMAVAWIAVLDKAE